MSLQLSDEPLRVLEVLQETIRGLKCNKQSRSHFDSLLEQLSELQPQLADSLQSMKEEAAYGQTLKQSQLKGLQEFSAALAAISAALQGPGGHTSPSGSTAGGSSNGSGSLSRWGVRPSASGRKPVLPEGVSTLNPDSFYHAKQSLVLALTQLHAAFKSSTPAMAQALARAKEEIEDIGLFE